ncbi:hypothetical protein M2140_000085 [Clostridiales Family XIII bacterium PM5-7]
MDTSKFYEYFQPEKCRDRIHIIGCGAVGSSTAELLVRIGLTKFTLYDFDTVEPHNISNQMFRQKDIGRKKTEALAGIMREINPDVDIQFVERYENQMLNGYVFMAVDKISVRKTICQTNFNNVNIKAVFDNRIRLTDAQAYGARWHDYKEKDNLLKSMNFTDEEADADTPVSACNTTLSLVSTVRAVCNFTIDNFINVVLGRNDEFKKMILVNTRNFEVDAF